MGYRPQRKTYNLSFKDHSGLEVKMTGTSLGNLQELMTAEPRNFQYKETREFFAKVADLIKSWNVEHPEVPGKKCSVCGLKEGAELPPTVEGLLCLDLEFIMEIVMAWGNAVIRVSVPKAPNSKNGGMPIPEELMKQLEMQQSPLTS